MTAHIGAPALAARTWETASRLSPDAADRARRLRLAAGAELDAGMTREAGNLLARAEATVVDGVDDTIERTHRLRLRCKLPVTVGGAGRPAELLREAARDVEPIDVGLSLDLQLDALERYIDAGSDRRHPTTIGDAVALRGRVDPERSRRIDIVEGALLLVRGDPRGETLLDRYREIGGPERAAEDAAFLVGIVAPTLGFLRRTSASDALLDDLETDLPLAWRHPPADRRPRRPGDRWSRPGLPRVAGRRARGDRPRREPGHARAGHAGGVGDRARRQR